MPKQLFLIRHAKATSKDTSLPDFDRPLSKRGDKEAATMSKRMAKKKVNFNCVAVSPAKRTMETAEYFIKELDVAKKNVLKHAELYLAPAEVYANLVKQIDDKFDAVAIVGHNDSITEFANTLCSVHIDEMPTCAIYSVKTDTNSWKDFDTSTKQFAFFDFPKND